MMNARGVFFLEEINYKATNISINYKNKKFDFLPIFKSSLRTFYF